MLLEHFKGLQDGSRQRAVINIDDEAAAAVLDAAAAVPCITYGVNNARADVRVESLDLTLWRTTVRGGRPAEAAAAPQHSSTAAQHFPAPAVRCALPCLSCVSTMHCVQLLLLCPLPQCPACFNALRQAHSL